jgi:uncharacterized protein HemX
MQETGMDTAGWVQWAIGVAVPLGCGGAGWLATLHNRQANISRQLAVQRGALQAHERECEERNKNADERHATVVKTLDKIDAKLDHLMERR